MKKTLTVLVLTILFVLLPSAVSAVEEHVDPSTVAEVYSGVSLLRYYSTSLDLVIQKNPAGTQDFITVIPFANVQQAITPHSQEFAQSAIAIAQALPEIDKLLVKRDGFIADARLTDAVDISAQIASEVKQALANVDSLQEAAVLTGNVLNINSAPAGGDLVMTYNDVLSKIARIRAIITLASAQNPNINELNVLSPTNLVFEITPESAFVGDTVHFEAVLTNNIRPLPGREVSVLLDGVPFVSATTGADGRCSGELVLPYWYISQVEARALYTPQGGDEGVFLASLSPGTIINLSFYTLSLTGSAEEGHPGLTETINASFDYGTSPPLKNRAFSLYLDDTLITELNAETGFSEMFVMAADTPTGPHLITISSPSDRRYAPALTSFSINVNKAPVTLELNKPGAVFIPGSIKFSGNAFTEIGPLNGARITIMLGSAKTTVTTASDGSFKVMLKTAPGLSLIGSQPVSVQITPSEPWNAPLSETQNLFAVNYLNCIGAAIALAFLGIYLPRRLGARAGSRGRMAKQISEDFTMGFPTAESAVLSDKRPLQIASLNPAQEKILYWYTRVLKFIQKLAGLAPRPQQTMREFADQTSSALGPVSRYFKEITLMAERSLYSPNKPIQSDVEKSRELAQSINTEVENETI